MKQLPGLAKRILVAGLLVAKFDNRRHCQLARHTIFHGPFWCGHARKARFSITSHLYPCTLKSVSRKEQSL